MQLRNSIRSALILDGNIMDLINIDVVAIPEAVREWCERNSHSRSTRFCAWLEYINGEMYEIGSETCLVGVER